MSSKFETDVQFRQTAAPATPAVLIALHASPYDRSKTIGNLGFWIAVSVFTLIVVAALSTQMTSPILGVVLFALTAWVVFRASTQKPKSPPVLRLIDRTLHRLDERGEVIESIADVRGEVQPVVWGFAARGVVYAGRALVLRFASGPLVVGLYPQPGALEGTRSDAPAWMLAQEDFDRLVRAAQP